MRLTGLLKRTLVYCFLLTAITCSPVPQYENFIVQSASDENQYRFLTLKNGLRTVLVSDVKADLSTVVIGVQAGGYADKAPGLAHFTEHMLFMGSKNYKNVSFGDYVEDRGGTYNGYTSSDRTVYYFQINHRYALNTSLILSDMLGEPLLEEKSFESAIEAVDSEYTIGLRNDVRSLMLLQNNLGKPGSPESRMFIVGSRETLNVTDIHEQVTEYHASYYSANLMVLVIVANDTLDNLEEQAQASFGEIPNNNRPLPSYKPLAFPTSDPTYLSKKIYYKKKTKGHNLEVMFPINLANFPSVDYITYLLGYEGVGSFDKYVTSRHLVTNCYTDIGGDISKTYFYKMCDLTDKGLQQHDAIVRMLFTYLNTVCAGGVNTEVWTADNDIKDLLFRFQDKVAALSTAWILSSNMMETDDVRAFLDAPSTRELDVGKENEILSFFSPNNFNIYLGSDTFSGDYKTEVAPQLTELEPRFKTPYLVKTLTDDYLNSLRNTPVDPDLHLPPSNPFTPTDFSILPVSDSAGPLPVEIQELEEGEASIWWMQDTLWSTPKIWTKCKIYPGEGFVADAYQAVQDALLGYLANFSDSLGFHDARSVGYDPYVTFSKAWILGMSGYSDPVKFELVLRQYMAAFVEFTKTAANVTEEELQSVAVTPALKSWDESEVSTLRQSLNNIERLLNDDFIDPSDKTIVAKTIKALDVQNYIRDFLEEVSVICSVMGNTRQEEALRLANIVKEGVQEMGSKLSAEDRRSLTDDKRMRKLEQGPVHVLRRKALSEEEATSAIITYYAMGRSNEDGGQSGRGQEYTLYALNGILDLIMSTSCFNYLRTEKKLGYSAGCMSYNDENNIGFAFFAQGSRAGAGPDLMQREIDNLVSTTYTKLQLLAETPEGAAKFEEVKKTVVEKLERARSFTRFDLFKTELDKHIFSSAGDFEVVDKKIAAVEAVTAETLLEFYQRRFLSEEKRVLSSQVYGSTHEMPDTVDEGQVLIENLLSYREMHTTI